MVKHISWITIFFFLIIFSGCVTKEGIKKTEEGVLEEAALRERVMAYWGYKIKQEFDKSYEYEDPFYRKTVNLVKYIKGFRTDVLRWKAAEIREMDIKGDKAVIKMGLKIDVKVPGVKRLERDSLITEEWVRVEGIWYHVPERATGRKD